MPSTATTVGRCCSSNLSTSSDASSSNRLEGRITRRRARHPANSPCACGVQMKRQESHERYSWLTDLSVFWWSSMSQNHRMMSILIERYNQILHIKGHVPPISSVENSIFLRCTLENRWSKIMQIATTRSTLAATYLTLWGAFLL